MKLIDILKKRFYFCRLGIETDYKGDAILWIWPWKRWQSNGMAWYSYSFVACFPTLEALDLLWDDYLKHMEQFYA